LSQHRLSIDNRDTAGTLGARLSQLCAEVTREQIPKVLARELSPTPQCADAATWAPPIRAADRQLDLGISSFDVDARVRALSPTPGALTTRNGRALRILETRPMADDLGLQPGTVTVTSDRRVLIATRQSTLELLRAQVEGKKPLSAAELVNGRSIAAGDQLGT
jgi:methionyl-tRNA formyltransferase